MVKSEQPCLVTHASKSLLQRISATWRFLNELRAIHSQVDICLRCLTPVNGYQQQRQTLRNFLWELAWGQDVQTQCEHFKQELRGDATADVLASEDDFQQTLMKLRMEFLVARSQSSTTDRPKTTWRSLRRRSPS